MLNLHPLEYTIKDDDYIPAFCELFNGGEADRKIIAVFTIAVAAYQSLLFTVTLLTFIQPLYVTCHRVRIQAGIVTVAVALFLLMALTSEECWVFFVAKSRNSKNEIRCGKNGTCRPQSVRIFPMRNMNAA